MTSTNSLFTRSDLLAPLQRIKQADRGQLWLTLDESSKVNNVKQTCHWEFRSEQWAPVLFAVRFLFHRSLKITYYSAQIEGRPNTIDRKCLWNNKSEHYTDITAGENSLQEVARWLNFPELAAEDVKLKIRTVCIRCAAELVR